MPGTRTSPAPDSPLLSEEQAAQLLGVAPRTLRERRLIGNGPPCHRPMGILRYVREELIAWVMAHPNENAGVR